MTESHVSETCKKEVVEIERKKVVETIAFGFLGTERDEKENHESSERRTTNGAKT